MRVSQYHYHSGHWHSPLPKAQTADLLLIFGTPELFHAEQIQADIRQAFSPATIAGCSGDAEIAGANLTNQSLIVNAIQWQYASNHCVSCPLDQFEDEYSAGQYAVQKLPKRGLRHVLIFCAGKHNGIKTNGSLLTKAIHQALPEHVGISGGIAEQVFDDVTTSDEILLLCGLYGDSLQVNTGCRGGWHPVGPVRLISKAQGNRLYELDNEPAITMYQRYLGVLKHESQQPSPMFPLGLYLSPTNQNDTTIPEPSEQIMRSVLNIDIDTHSIIFAGDIPQGQYAQLMHASADLLIEGAAQAAQDATQAQAAKFALLVSCCSRRQRLQQRTEEEIEAVHHQLQPAVISGFYSLGEVAALNQNQSQSGSQQQAFPTERPNSEAFHNEVMAITTFAEMDTHEE